MIYLKKIELLSESSDYIRMVGVVNTNIYNDVYPYKIFPDKELEQIDFDNITILYGGNGSGKSTLLNIIAQKVNAIKKSLTDRGEVFDSYVEGCEVHFSVVKPLEIKIISSDDIFDFLLDLRSANRGVDNKRRLIKNEFMNNKYDNTNPYDTVDNLKDVIESKNTSMSKYVRKRLTNQKVIMESNGETSLNIWQREINDDSLYILDEPENSLSPANQLKLKQFIEESVRFYNCQFIIATHSPFLLGLNEAKIYDLDKFPAEVSDFDDLENIKIYKEFFSDKY